MSGETASERDCNCEKHAAIGQTAADLVPAAANRYCGVGAGSGWLVFGLEGTWIFL